MKYVKNFLSYGVSLLIFITCPFLLKAQQAADTLDLSYKEIAPEDFNGAAYTITMDQFKNLPVTNLTNLLTGIVPGFFSIQRSGGTADEGADYWIRGIRTTAEGVLVLVDGQERAFGVLSSYEIESITVLKDALATVLYGTRAANGAILVTTRKGKKGKPAIELTAQLIRQKPLSLLKPLNALDYAIQHNKALQYDGMSASEMYAQQYLQQYRAREGVNPEHYPDVNWLDDYFRKQSWVQAYNLSISGGSDRTRYFVNGNFLDQDGMFHTDQESNYSTNNRTRRYNLRSNLEVDVTKTTLLNVDLYGWYDKQNRPGGDSYGAYNALVTTPSNAFPPYYLDDGGYMDQDGNKVAGINGRITAGDGIRPNPWALLNRNGYSVLNRVYGSFRTKLTQDLAFITPGLKASALLSMDTYTASVTDRQKTYAYYQLADVKNPDVLRRTNTDEQMNNDVTDQKSEGRNALEVQLNYQRALKKHNISALVFYNQYEFTDQTSVPSRFQTIGSWLGYNYNRKYYLDITGSYQGIYKFAPGKRFGLFPAVAAGWAVSNEKFFSGIRKYVSYFKLRGSYGVAGNQRGVSEFQYMGRLNAAGGVYNFGNNMGGVGGYVEDIIANPGLTWEKATQANVGVNLNLFRDRFRFVFDYFSDNREDLYLVNNNITALFGTVATIRQNIGSMRSQGYDIGASWNAAIGALGYTLGATYSFARNENLKTGEVPEPYPWLQETGYARGLQRGYVALGLFDSYDEIAAAPRQTFSTVRPGDIRYKDINGDGIIDRNDIVPIGYGNTPQVFYGLNAGLTYKGIGFSILFQGAGRVSRMLTGKVAYPFFADGNMYEHQLDYWTPENKSARWPVLSTLNSGVNNTQPSSFWLMDARYLRLKNVELSYELPESILKRSFIKNIRLFANGYNLYVWTPGDSLLDPEDSGNSDTMPLTRNMSVGCSFRF
ncbi:SusC/RagA family TonB-linked outer membrane protein [Niabella aurantiaca]|uniref:SusC/RagA family TonB-linked outer membrane protein n=1 Tax=Niabella aurantiaca TaxID=379900 RepID=UPI000368B06B|nr:TonB-dependent receptor [Niabella aurantiaca]